MKKTKKSLLFSGLALMMSALLLAGTTFAWFTDSVTNKGNTIQAGKLDIGVIGYTLENGEWKGPMWENNLTNNPLFTETTWEPGQYGAILIRVSSYDSTLAEKVSLDFTITDNGKNLADALWYKLHAVQTVSASYQGAMLDALEFKDHRPASEADGVTTMSKIEEDATEPLTLYPDYHQGQYAYYVLEYGMYTSAGNEYQGGSFGLDFSVNATQAPYEEDGFGSDQYDKDADSTQIVYNNSFDSDKGDWSEGTVENGVFVPVAGAYSWYNNYANKGERLADTWTASVDVHVDLDKAGKLFEMTNAANKNDGTHLRDFVVRLQKVNNEYKVLMSNNANQDLYSDDYATQNAVGTISESGWYTMKWEYSFVDNALSCTMSLVNRETGTVVATKTLSSATDTDDIVGFNHYLWVYQVNEFAAFEMDNQTLCYE